MRLPVKGPKVHPIKMVNERARPDNTGPFLVLLFILPANVLKQLLVAESKLCCSAAKLGIILAP
ncbi:MAG: hypothetical protein CMM28_12535 [Rhodospirillaceae bacterium]|nr:hypothetical protein [Rhodospirillaceae bacterium]